jgi:cytochrome c peroxidase
MNRGARRRGWLWVVVVAAAGVLASGRAGAQQAADEALIEEGRRLFLEETFDGNGRTCGTCHPPTNNFTIDPEFIRTLRGNDPLFVKAPSEPDLKELEVKRLLQRFGLVLENVDGLDQPGVLRGVPHTLGLSQSITPDQPLIDAGITHATGWSGEGSPGRQPDDPNGGSLKNFAMGAVIQHFPKSLNRVPGVDFRLPTEDELDALEAFQLFLGRQEEVNIDPADPTALAFTDAFVEVGRALFDDAPSRNGNGRRCAACHNNAGANNASGVNRNFATGTMFLANAPGCLLGFVAPGDGGFGVEPVQELNRADLCGKGPQGGPKATVRFQGDLTMNTPSLIEAADTPPFFHNNTAATIEDAVAFYTSDIFNDSPSGNGNAFVLTEEEIHQIAALLRALNALENIRSSNAYSEQALRQSLGRAEESVELAIFETTDAIEVLTGGPVELFAGTDTISLLEEARALERQALAQGLTNDALLEEAIALKETARGLMIE